MGKEYKTPALQVAEERSDERTVRGQEQVFYILERVTRLELATFSLGS